MCHFPDVDSHEHKVRAPPLSELGSMFIRTVLSVTLTKVIKQPQAKRSRKCRCVAFCSRIYRRRCAILDRHDSLSVTEDTVDDDTVWIQLILSRKKQGEGVSERS